MKLKDEHERTMNWRNYVESDPQILRGKPCVKGKRIPAAVILGYLAQRRSHEEIIRQFPDLTSDDVSACLDYARELAEFNAVAA